MHISELDTPVILIDLDVMDRNLTKMATYAREHNLRLRPHTKTHKIPDLGRRQLKLGAAGITVAKTTEAEVMLASGTPDLLVAYPVIGAQKLNRLLGVAAKTNVTVSLDSKTAAEELAGAAWATGASIGVLVETDVGLGRVGIKPGKDLVGLAKFVDSKQGLEFLGIAFYPGHVKSMDAAGQAAFTQVGTLLQSIASDLQAAGLEAKIWSGGSTPTMWRSHEMPMLNEIRPGTYIFNDRNTIISGACGQDDCAASILATVVSTSVANQYIIDGGSKTFSSDLAKQPGHGIVLEAPESVFARMNEEHGYVELPDASSRFNVGDRVRVIPNHVCVAINLHEQVYGIRNEMVEHTWTVAARGKLQ